MTIVAPSAPERGQGLQAFNFEGAEIRTVLVDGELWWVARDVCTVLGVAQAGRAVEGLDEDEVSTTHVTDSMGRQQETFIINEPGLYSLILRSRKPQAKAFKRWITHEVIPAIRRTGSYTAAPPAIPSPRDLALLVLAEADRADAAEAKVAELEPAAKAWDVLASVEGDYSLRDAAHILNRDPNISTGQQRLMRSVRELGMIDRNGVPYAKNAAHLRERIQTYRHPRTGEATLAKPQIRVTVQGMKYLHGKLGGVMPLRFDDEQLPEVG